MTTAQYSHNHQIDKATGFMENPAYLDDFDATRKLAFLDLFKRNGLKIWKTSRELGLSCDTVHRHYNIDPVFKKAFDDAQKEYIDELEGISRINAMEPKMVIERIFQLKSLLPGKYGDQKINGSPQIIINIDGKMIEQSKNRDKIIEAKIIEDEMKAVDNQHKRVLALEQVNNNMSNIAKAVDTHQD